MANPNQHIVAIFGGAVSGAEAAYQLTQSGIQVVVFDQETLPYGKIEDGLPKWHVKLRDKEERNINKKLSHPLVSYVPNVRLGKDVDFEDVVNNWGFSAVMLATGAWRDRPLPIEGIDAYINKGLYYQNPFIYWFNHYHEPNFSGQQYEIVDDTIVVGGGLASIDVVKAIMMLSVQKALRARGHDISIFKLDRSIAKVLDGLGLTLEDLGIKGCTLYYRRRIKDMPLSPMKADTPEKVAKLKMVQEKILNNARNKYLFRVQPLHVPVDKVIENGHLTALVFKETEIKDGRVVPIEGSEKTVKSPLVISSIGSLPEPIEGIPMKWQTFEVDQNNCCRIKGFEHVFALGNAVTGRGNIKESLQHGRQVTQKMIESYLLGGNPKGAYDKAKGTIEQQVSQIIEEIQDSEPPSENTVHRLEDRIEALQQKVGYEGDFMQWVEQHLPLRLEDMIGEKH